MTFVLDEFNVSYARFAELSAPFAMHFKVVEKYYRKRSLSGYTPSGTRPGYELAQWMCGGASCNPPYWHACGAPAQ
ncbi:hypothetical protein [Mycetohabitans endofungorum]|uniref:hypothetical protein n=1 Tax=Mycetohabitans endofungorum TaxID=417203 RepID=UPI002B06062E|nr:hypothetical protein [Mycetohabitans endofungorum]